MDISNSEDEQDDENVPEEELGDDKQETEESHNNNSLKIVIYISTINLLNKFNFSSRTSNL